MTTSGTSTWNPPVGDMIIEAFDRANIRATSLTRAQIVSAYRSLNYTFQTWSNRGVNLWAIDLQSVPLIAGQATYNCPQDTIQVEDVYMNTLPSAGSSGDPIGRVLYPISRNDYAAIPDKVAQGTPSEFWFDKTSPIQTLTLWYVPNASNTWTMNYYRLRRLQDASPAGGQTADVPYRFLEATVADLAARLAQKYNPQMWPVLREDAKVQWDEAATADVEKVTMYLLPEFSDYYR